MEETDNVITIDVPLLTPEDIDELRQDMYCYVAGEKFKNDNCLLSEFRVEYPEHREPIETQREAIQFIKHNYPDRIVLTEAPKEEEKQETEAPKEEQENETPIFNLDPLKSELDKTTLKQEDIEKELQAW